MPDQLKIKAARQAPVVRQLFVAVIFGVPILYLLYLGKNHQALHFPSPMANLVAHAMLFLFPIVWALVVTAGQIEFTEPPGELLRSARFRGRWWQSILLYPSLTLGIVFATDSAWRILSRATAQPSTPAGEAAFTMILVGIFASLLLLKAKAYAKVWVLQEGLHIGLGRFLRWDEMHHVRWQGHDVELFHVKCQGIPTVAASIRDDVAREELKQTLSKHGIPESESVSPSLILVKLAVSVLAAVIFWVGLAARFHHGLDAKWVVLIALVAGLFTTWLLERVYVPSSTRVKRPAIVKERE